MRNNICSHEIAAAQAVRTVRSDDALREHAATCAACSETIIVATGMRSLAADLDRDDELPDAAWLWRKALLDKKQAEADRTVGAFRVPQLVSMPLMVLGFILLITWS